MTKSRWLRVLALLLGLSMIAAACGDDDEEASDTDQTEDTGDSGSDEGEGAGGGEFIDYGTFVGDPPEHIDPALNSALDNYQVVNAMYDGLTDIDASDPDNPKIVPHVAESVESNEDATLWTFTIKEDQAFSNGEEILPSTFKRSWERAAAMGGDYSYLMTFIEGGQEALDNPGSELTGVVADDEAMTLEVTLADPYSNFDAVAGFQLFFPMPEEAGDAASPVADYENDVMVGNGPYVLEAARTDEEIVLVKNDEWRGDFNGDTWDDRLDRIIFRVQADPDTGYNAFEAGEADNANIPPGRVEEAQANYGTTLDVAILGSFHVDYNQRAPEIGGPENLKLRQAISAAIDREQINEAVYQGSRTVSTGITPPGIPGFKKGLCEYCAYDPEQARTLFEEWQAEGGSLDGPLPIQFPADTGNEPVVQIIVDNLAEVGIEAESAPMDAETYFSEISDGACVICRAGWFADYPTYDNFMFDLYHSSAIGGNNHGFQNPEFDALVDQAKATVDEAERAELFNQAEQILLNDETGAIPLLWYRGDYVYNQDKWDGFTQSNFGLIPWERIRQKA